MIDNLRRTLTAPTAVLALTVGWTLPFSSAFAWTMFVLSTVLVPNLIPLASALLSRRPGVSISSHSRALGVDFRLALVLSALNVVFLADQAWMLSDAILRTLWRLFISRRHLLEWTTAARATAGKRLDLSGFVLHMVGGLGVAAAALFVTLMFGSGAWPVAAPIVALWLVAPAVARWISLPPASRRASRHLSRSGSGLAADRAAYMAVFRYIRDAGRQLAAAGQFPGGPRGCRCA